MSGAVPALPHIIACMGTLPLPLPSQQYLLTSRLHYRCALPTVMC
jgi:hypothetical protein